MAKLNAYGLDKASLDFLYSYLSKKKQRTKMTYIECKMNNEFKEITSGAVS